MLTVVLTSEARLYRYLTCGGQSTHRRRVGKICIVVEKVSGIETQGRLGLGWGTAQGPSVSRVRSLLLIAVKTAESSEDCLIACRRN